MEGGNSWCSSARGAQLQKSTFLIMACKLRRRRPFERKQGRKSGGEREREQEADVRATLRKMYLSLRLRGGV